eukprot:SAG31_NODE_3179_length_4583_cov_1.884478_4_plen_108_part_00
MISNSSGVPVSNSGQRAAGVFWRVPDGRSHAGSDDWPRTGAALKGAIVDMGKRVGDAGDWIAIGTNWIINWEVNWDQLYQLDTNWINWISWDQLGSIVSQLNTNWII